MSAMSSLLRRLSGVLAWMALVAAALLPVWLFLTYFPQRIGGLPLQQTDSFIARMPLDLRLGAMLVSAVPLAFSLWAWLSAYRLFRLYAVGEVYSLMALRRLRQIALALLAVAVSGLIADPLVTLFVTWNTGFNRPLGLIVPGFSPDMHVLLLSFRIGAQHTLTFQFGFGPAYDLFKAAAVFIAAKVMEDAGRV